MLKRCEEGKCFGLATGEYCTSTSQCNPGLYCTSNACAATVSLANACTSDDDCGINAICEHTANTCQTTFTEIDGTAVQDPRRCKTGVKLNTVGSSGNCATTVKTQF